MSMSWIEGLCQYLEVDNTRKEPIENQGQSVMGLAEENIASKLRQKPIYHSKEKETRLILIHVLLGLEAKEGKTQVQYLLRVSCEISRAFHPA